MADSLLGTCDGCGDPLTNASSAALIADGVILFCPCGSQTQIATAR